MKVGIFGGTFNPIHKGHSEAALAFLTTIKPDRLLIIPTNIPPHKAIKGDDDPAVRLEMTKLAFADHPDYQTRIEVSDLEIRSEGKSYTYYTLQKIREMGYDEIFLYCGTDMLLSFDSWFRFEDILKTCTLVYASRLETEDPAVEEKMKMLRERYGAKILVLAVDPIEISSSEIREMVRLGQNTDPYLSPAVSAYIAERGLYR